MDKRIDQINQLLTAYSQGRFDMRLPLTNVNDELNACIWGFNIIGEELEEIAITRDYFDAIFNTVSEMVLVVTAKGVIEDLNRAVSDQLGYPKEGLIGQPLDILTGESARSLFREFRQLRAKNGVFMIRNKSFVTITGRAFPVDLSIKYLDGRLRQQPRRILLTAKDLTAQIAAENKGLRAVIDGQEQERRKLARDLHDGLGQKLAAINFLVMAATRECKEEKANQKLSIAQDNLLKAIEEMHRIAFSLMPKTLEDFGLAEAVRELAAQVQHSSSITVNIRQSENFPSVPGPLKIDLFRVVQECIANAIRHSDATRINIHFGASPGQFTLQIVDNGQGFDPTLTGGGMGLRNMHSRVKSHNGHFRIKARPGAGTTIEITIPIQ